MRTSRALASLISSLMLSSGLTAAVLVTTKPEQRPYETGGEGGVIKARGVFQ